MTSVDPTQGDGAKIRLDAAFLREVGLDELSPTEKKLLLGAVYTEMEMRVGLGIARSMTNEELDEWDLFVKTQDDEGALSWIERNRPNYRTDVQAVFGEVTRELRDAASVLLHELAERRT